MEIIQQKIFIFYNFTNILYIVKKIFLNKFLLRNVLKINFNVNIDIFNVTTITRNSQSHYQLPLII